MLTFKTLYVLVLIAHGRCELVHVAVTAHPAAAWVWRQVVEATAWGRRPRFFLRDRDAVSGGDFGRPARGAGDRAAADARACPGANAVAERLIGTLRRECLVWWGWAVGEDHPRECWGCRRPRSRRGGPRPVLAPNSGAVWAGRMTGCTRPGARARWAAPPQCGLRA